jgi:hypothetical protein
MHSTGFEQRAILRAFDAASGAVSHFGNACGGAGGPVVAKVFLILSAERGAILPLCWGIP